MQSITEQELVLSLKNKDPRSFTYLYDNYAPALYGSIIRLLYSKEASEDCLQEVFLKLWNNIDHYDSHRGRLFTWMMTVTRNQVIDTLRSKSHHQAQRQMANVPEEWMEHIPADTGKHDSIGIWKFIAGLQPSHQKVVQLFYFGGHSHREISELMAIPVGTVKTKIRQAMSDLRLSVL